MNFPYFSDDELKCPCCGENKMDVRFMDRLVGLRSYSNIVMPITSGYRCGAHNKKVGGVATSAHVVGRAVDINLYQGNLFDLLPIIKTYGMTGVGLKQTGKLNKRMLHLDDLGSTELNARPTVWTY